MTLALVSAIGCAPSNASALAAAIVAGGCSELAATELRDLCRLERLECEAIEGELQRAECAFRTAEASGRIGDCADAGPFLEDCRMHLWSASFSEWAPKQPEVGRDEPLVAEHIAEARFNADDMRPWSAWYRLALGRHQPMDRGACRSVTTASIQKACLETGLSLYGDRLNNARDRHLYPCDGGELPAFLQTTPDPELDALRASRSDLCP